jgi:hypothetical protein
MIDLSNAKNSNADCIITTEKYQQTSGIYFTFNSQIPQVISDELKGLSNEEGVTHILGRHPYYFQFTHT